MNFKVLKSYPVGKEKNTLYLIENDWDDWFTYETTYNVLYKDELGCPHSLDKVKIGQKQQEDRRPNLPASFKKLDDTFFSLGTSRIYYEKMKKLEVREEILSALNDIAFNLEIFKEVADEDVVRNSLLRDITSTTVKGQFNRIANGGAILTDYNFEYIFPRKTKDEISISFSVECEKTPPTNIHVLIGKNGVGKTTILKEMLFALKAPKNLEKYGEFKYESKGFSNVVFVSFSAFDMSISSSDFSDNTILPYTFVGLVNEDSVKGKNQLADDFFDSLYKIVTGQKKNLWEKMIDILESDNTFTHYNIKEWSNVRNSIEEISKGDMLRTRYSNSNKNELRKEYYSAKILPIFKEMSSGHTVILLTIAKLIEFVEEKTIVFIDEPEEHLHPPLVSAFIRALSELLIYRNGVGIIATHSPVIVQEVPKKCVWKLRREGDYIKCERPERETFGENLGELTSEIFSFEVTNSGFHKMLKDAAEKKDTYEEALAYFDGQLGKEARAILKSYMYEKEGM